MKLDEITRMVLEVSPQLVDPREASAIVESCGVNDRLANEFGMPHTFALGEYIFRHNRTAEVLPTYGPEKPFPGGPSAKARIDRDVLELSGVTHMIWLEGINDFSKNGNAPLEKVQDQQHFIMPALNFHFLPQLELNLGVGIGVTRASNGIFLKSIVGWEF